MKKLILICFVLSFFSIGTAQWKKIFPLDSAGTYRIVKIINSGENNLFAFTYEYTNDHGLLLKSTDAGDNWSIKEFFYKLHDIYCADSLNLLILVTTGYPDYEGKLLSSSDGGENWSVKIDTLQFPNNITFINKDIGFITCGSGLIKTTDGGANWIAEVPPPASPCQLISYFDDNNIIVTSYDNFFKTTDGGINWVVKRILGTGDGFRDIAYIRSNLIYSAMWQLYPSPLKSISKSTDGGVIWHRIYSYTFNGNYVGEIRDINFNDANSGFGVGAGGHICLTTDGGVSWTVQNSGTTEDLNSIIFTSGNTGYIAGNNIILKTTNRGVTYIDNQIKNTPGDYTLLQNYPNPFNPSTEITYTIKSSGVVTLKVFDLLGRETALLVNEYKPAGAHKVTFTAKDLPSGVYFYSLRVNEYISVKKMVLIK